MDRERAALVERFLDGSLDAGGLQIVLDLAEGDEGFRRELAGAMRMSGLISSALRPPEAYARMARTVGVAVSSEEQRRRFASRVMARLGQAGGGASRRFSRRGRAARRVSAVRVRPLAAAVAAAAALAVTVAWLANRPADSVGAWTAVAEVTAGSARLERVDGAVTLAGAGTAMVRAGERLVTAEGGRAKVSYDDGTVVEMNEKTSLSLGASISARLPMLEAGDIYVRAAGLMTVNAGQYDEASVAGTEFEVSKPAGSTVLRVAEGRVRFGAGSAAVAVASLQASRVAPGGAPGAPGPVALAAIASWRDGLNRGLVGCWKFDEGRGDAARDSSGKGNHGKIRGAEWTEGRIGRALRFRDAAFVTVGSRASLRITDQVTLAAWIRILGPGSKDANRPLFIIGQDGHARNYALAVVGDGAGRWRLQVSHRWERGEFNEYKSSAADVFLKGGEWYHVAAVITPADGGSHRYFLNGEPAGELKNLGFARMMDNASGRWIGCGSEGRGFDGIIDEVRIYHRSLDAAEIARLAGGRMEGERAGP